MDNQVNQTVDTQSFNGNKCVNCGAVLAPGQAFCAVCGTAAPVVTEQSSVNRCSNCGNELPNGVDFCPQCGQKVALSAMSTPNPAIEQFNASVTTKKKNKFIIPIVVGVVAVIAIIIGIIVNNSIQEQKREEAIALAREEYIENAEEFASLSLTAGSNLEDIADTIQSYWYDAIWKDYYSGDIDIAISRALSAKSSAISTAENYDSQMRALYNKLRYIPDGLENDSEIEDLCDAVKNLYNVYTDYYSFATDPSGSYNSFSSSNGTKTDNYVSAYRALSNLVN